MILEKNNQIYHDEHDIEISISNDNTKHLKVCKIKLRADILSLDDAKKVIEKANELYKEAVGN